MYLLRLLLVVKLSQIFLILMTLTILKSTGQIFCTMSFNRHLSDVFLTMGLGLWFSEEGHTGEVTLIASYQEYVDPINMNYYYGH